MTLGSAAEFRDMIFRKHCDYQKTKMEQFL